MSLAEELEAAAGAASGYGAVSAVLAADEAPARRAYLVALGEDDERRWLVLDAELAPVDERARVREVASVVALCELAVELAAGGGLAELRAELAGLRERGEHDGLAGAELAAAALAEVIGEPPRVASADFLDRVGAATRRLERELGDRGSPLAGALQAHSRSVEAFVAEVDGAHRLPLR